MVFKFVLGPQWLCFKYQTRDSFLFIFLMSQTRTVVGGCFSFLLYTYILVYIAPFLMAFLIYIFKVLQPRVSSEFPVKGVWVPSVPAKTAFFAWEAVKGKVLTLDMWQRRGWQLPNRCCSCETAEETVHHFPLLDPSRGKVKKKTWNFVSLCIFWTI